MKGYVKTFLRKNGECSSRWNRVTRQQINWQLYETRGLQLWIVRNRLHDVQQYQLTRCPQLAIITISK